MTEPAPPRSPLAPFAAAMREADPDGAWSYAQRIWLEHGVVVLLLDQVEARNGWVAARMARGLAEQVFGKRRGG